MLVRDVVRAEPRMRPSAVCALPQKRAAEDSPIARAIRHAIQQRRDGGARVVDGLAGEQVWGRASPAPPAPVQPYTLLSVAEKRSVVDKILAEAAAIAARKEGVPLQQPPRAPAVAAAPRVVSEGAAWNLPEVSEP